MNNEFKTWLQHIQQQINQALDQALPIEDAYPVIQAMRYAALDAGKRVRPALVFAAGEALYLTQDKLIDFACALELVHCYSLVHDDLPAMDDDDLRRGRPTCHKAFDEATAILAGDGLLTQAFNLLSETPRLTANEKISAIRLLAKAAGHQGMILGQSMDMTHEANPCDLETLKTLHRLKTGALIEAALNFPATIETLGSEEKHHALASLGEIAGLLFQVQDDILDVISDTQTLGKPQGSDTAREKSTYVSLLGLEAAQALRDQLMEKTQTQLALLGETSRLAQLVAFIAQRSH
jgi:geranylgeranyl pyrophosphate synthase